MDEAIKNVEGSAYNAVQASFFWTRVIGLVCAVILIIEPLVMADYVNNCIDVYGFLSAIEYIPILVIITIQPIYVQCIRRNEPSVGKKIRNILNEFIFNIATFILSTVFESILLYTLNFISFCVYLPVLLLARCCNDDRCGRCVWLRFVFALVFVVVVLGVRVNEKFHLGLGF